MRTIPYGNFRTNRASSQAKGLIGWWPSLGSRSGATWHDRSGQGINLTETGAVNETSALFLGWTKNWTADAYFGTTAAGALSGGWASASFAFWVRTSVIDANWVVILSKNFDAGTDSYYIARAGANLYVWLYAATTAPEITVLNVFDDTDWHHIGVSYDGANATAYVDGVAQAPVAGEGVINAGAGTTLRIGARFNDSQYWRGDIAEVRIYNRALTAAEMWQLYAPETRWALYDAGDPVNDHVVSLAMLAEHDWAFFVDWDNDRDFDEAYEDIFAYVKSAVWELGMDSAYQSTGGDSTLTLTLNNFGKEFSPENAESPFYGELLPQRLVKVVCYLTGVDEVMFLGYLQPIRPAGGDGRTAILTASGPQRYFEQQPISLPLLENIRSDVLIEAILGRLQLPAALDADIWLLGIPGHSELGTTTVLADLSPAVELDTGLMTFPYAGDNWTDTIHDKEYIGEDWKSGFNGMDAIVDVVRAERGRFFINRAGKAVFWSRARLQLKIDVDATFDMQFAGEPDYAYGEDMANRVHVKAYPRAISATSDSLLWELDEDITIRPYDTHTMTVEYSDEDTGAEVAGKDAYLDAAALVHNGISVDFAPEFEARNAKIAITNNDSFDVTITGMAIKGKKLTTYNEVGLVAEDMTALVQYGILEYTIESKLLSDVLFAQTLADYELERRKAPRGAIRSMTVRADTDARTEQVVNRTIGDRIAVIDDQLSHDGEYFIIGERHEYGLREFYNVTWRLEPAENNKYWLLGVAGYSELGTTTKLAL